MLADEMQQINPLQDPMQEAKMEVSRIMSQYAVEMVFSGARIPFKAVWKLARFGADAYKDSHLKAEINYNKLLKYADKTHSSLMVARCRFTPEQMQEFSRYAKEFRIPFSAIKKDQPDRDGAYEYHLVYRDKDVELLRMIQEDMIRNKLERDKASDALMNAPESFNDISNEKVLGGILEGDGNPEPVTGFDNVLDCFSAKREEISPENPVYICSRDDPDAYIELTAYTDRYEGREYLVSKFDLTVGGIRQSCDEFSHGEFTHFSRMDGGNETPEGAKHWENMKNELKGKGGFSDDVLIFTDRGEFDAYAQFIRTRRGTENGMESYKQKKDRFTEELSKLDGKSRTDAALQSVLKEEIKINQDMARTERGIRDADEALKTETVPEKRKALDEKKKDLQVQMDGQREKMKALEKSKDLLFGIRFLDERKAGKSKEELDGNQAQVLAAVRGRLSQLQTMKWQQEDGFRQILPLGHNILPLQRTLTTEAFSLFLPFTSQELNDRGGVYYSLNLVSQNMIRINRKTLNNPNGFILGESGSGKSFLVKKELLSTFFTLPDEQIYIIDPEAEYSDIVAKLKGQVIKIGVGSPNYINICDMDKSYASSGDPIAEKVDFLLSVCESMARGLSAAQQSIIDHVTGQIYQDYIQDYDPEKLPTFVDFYEKIMDQEEQDAKDLGLALRTYATGSLSIFAKKTNVDLQNRLVCFDISALGSNLQNVGLLVVSELIWNKLCANRNKISTSIYIDEFHLMFKNKTSENFADQLYARIRKYGGKVTGITQNVDTLLQSEKARGMLGNSLFTCMLSQSDTNRKILEDMFSIGEDQLSYITNADKGHGLIRKGATIVPFGDVFPKDNPLYRYMTSNPEELKSFLSKEKNND